MTVRLALERERCRPGGDLRDEVELGCERRNVHDAVADVGGCHHGSEDSLHATLTGLTERGAFEPDGAIAPHRHRVRSAWAEGLSVVGAFDLVNDLAVFDHGG